MDLTKFDMSILLCMAIAIIFMSFTFPALGLGGDNVGEGEIPEFNITANRFDWTGEFPAQPGNPTSGTLVYEENRSSPVDDNRNTWLERSDGTDDYTVSLTHFNGSISDPEPTFRLIRFNDSDGSEESSDFQVIEAGETGELETGDFVVHMTRVSTENVGESNLTIEGDWEVIESPNQSGGISGLFSGIASAVGWIGTVIWWISATIVTTFLNLLGIVFDVASFIVEFVVFISSTYAGLVSNAPTDWAGVITAIPGVLFSLVFAKAVLVFVSILPTT